MIVEEIIEISSKNFRRTYSDADFYIQKYGTDEIYAEAIDLLNKKYTYIETDKKIEREIENE